jgi:hypothetical protein
MIEINRWIRVKPQGLCWAERATDNGDEGVYVYFKRFDVENGKVLDPERSFLTFKDLEEKLAESERQAPVIKELLGLKPPS